MDVGARIDNRCTGPQRNPPATENPLALRLEDLQLSVQTVDYRSEDREVVNSVAAWRPAEPVPPSIPDICRASWAVARASMAAASSPPAQRHAEDRCLNNGSQTRQ